KSMRMISPFWSGIRAVVNPGVPGCGSMSVMTVTPVHRCPRRSGSHTARTGVNAPIFDRYVDADDFQDCFIMPAHIVGGTFLGRLHPAITRLCLQGAGTQ